MSTSKSDIKLGQFLTLESDLINFKSDKGTRAGISMVNGSDGTGNLIIRGGDDQNDRGGLILEDETGSRVVQITKGRGFSSTNIAKTRVFLDGSCGNLTLGGSGHDGDIILRNHSNDVMVHISGQAGRDSNTVGYTPNSNAKLRIDAALGTYDFGGLFGGKLNMRDNNGTARISLNGKSGFISTADIVLGSGTSRITSLKNKISELEARIAALES